MEMYLIMGLSFLLGAFMGYPLASRIAVSHVNYMKTAEEIEKARKEVNKKKSE